MRIDTLVNIADPSPRAGALAQFTWRLVDTPEPNILPDCVAIALDRSGNWQPVMGADHDELVTIYMPLGATRLLIGEKADSPEATPHLFNIYAAACSRKFFISSVNTPEVQQLLPIIGVQSNAIMTAAIKEAGSEFLPPKPVADSPLAQAREGENDGIAPVPEGG